MKNTKLEIERFFRKYTKHCISPDIDSLKDLLSSAYSLNDKMRKESEHNFFDCNEFITIKGLRNYYDHEAELYNETRILPIASVEGLYADGSLFMCLVKLASVDNAIKNLRRSDDKEPMRQSLNYYGNVVDINPCLLNFAVKVYEKTKELNLDINTEEYLMLEDSYHQEEELGISHFVNGQICCHAGSVSELLEHAFYEVEEY